MLVALLCAGLNSAWGDTFKLYSGEITEGDYIIYYNGKAMKSNISSNRLQYEEITPQNDFITTTNDLIIWHISKDGNDWTIYNASANKFAGGTTTKNQAALLSSLTDDHARWTVTGNVTYDFENKGRASDSNDNENKWLRNNGNYGFACYSSGMGGALTLYKKDNRIHVNLIGFTATNTILIKNETTTTSVTNDQPGWTPSYNYKSDEESIATVDESGIITAIGKGTTTITATLNVAVSDERYTVGETASKTLEITVNNPSHTATFSINGTTSSADFEEGTAINFPANPSDIEGKTFVGWTTEAITGTIDETPALLTSATMGNDDVTYYAVFATKTEGGHTEITDVLNNANTINNTSNNYSNWNNKIIESSAIYAGNSAGDNSSIQLRSKDNSGIVSTSSGGNAKKITVTWNSNTADGRTLDIYGSNTAYTAASALYGDSRGTKVGSIVKGASTELTISDNYAYIGLRSYSGAMYLDNISITWIAPAPNTYSEYATTIVPPVAQIGTQKFETLQAAVNAAQPDETITLLTDVADAGSIYLKAGVTLDGAGKNITGNSAVYINKDGGTIQNVNFKNIHNANNNLSAVYGNNLEGTATITGCSFDNCDWDAIQIVPVADANVIITNNSFSDDQNDGVKQQRYIHVQSAQNVDFSATITENVMTGKLTQEPIGVYYPTDKTKVDLTKNYIESYNDVCILIADNDGYAGELVFPAYTTAEKQQTWTPVAMIQKGKYAADLYETLAEAVAALTEDNNTIALLADVEATYTLPEGQTLNVALNGHTLTVNAPEGYVLQTSETDGVTTYSYAPPVAKIGDVQYASLAEAVAAAPAGEETTITMIADEIIVGNAGVMIPVGKNVVLDLNGKTITLNISEAKASQLITNRGVLTITDSSEEQNGKLTNAADESLPVGTWPDLNFATNIITNSGTLNVEGGTIQNNANGSICYAIDNNSTSYDAILNVKGGRLTAVGTVIRQFCNSDVKQNILNVSGGIIETNGSAAMWTQLPGSNANSKKLATLNISGGKVKGAKYAWYDYSFGDSFEAVNYSITGGEIYGKLSSDAVANGVKPGFVTGGLFSMDVNNVCAEGLTTIASEEHTGMFEIGPADIYYAWKENGALVGEYLLLATPFVKGYLMDGEFITLQKDVALTENIACLLAEGSFNFTLGEYNVTKGDYSISLLPNVSVLTDKKTNIFSAAEVGYVIKETETENGFSYTAVELLLAKPIIFHDEGTYEGPLTVAMAGQGTIKYKLNDGEEQTYSAPFEITEKTTITAWTEVNGVKSEEETKAFTFKAAEAGPAIADGYYTIKNNGNNKYVQVAGRKTVVFDDNTNDAGTVIRVKSNDKGQVEVLRSQGVDIPGYAQRAMNYVDDIIELAVEKLELQNLLGSTGEQTLLKKFHDSFDYNLYLEETDGGYRIYGKTPSMKHVVDFYAENKDKVDAKLPMMEERINYAINKLLEKVGRGLSLKDQFNIHRIWEDMNVEGLTEPVEGDDAAIARFYEEVLSSEAKVWLFAYEAAMYYVNFVEGKDRFMELKAQYPEYFKYWDMAKRVQPNFMYYIVQKDNQIDFISEGNEDIIYDKPNAIWTLNERQNFKVAFNLSQEKTVCPTEKEDDETTSAPIVYTEYYTTLNTDFAYNLPDGMIAYQITGIGEIKDNETMGTVLKKKLEGTIPAQTPVLLIAKEETAQLELADDVDALSGNELHGNEFLIEKDELKNTILKTVFETIQNNFDEELYARYVAEYEHLMLLNSGTVNNKYFFNLSKDNDLAASKSYNKGMVMVLGQDDDLGVRFHYASKEDLKGNEAFMFDEGNKLEDIVMSLKGDINRDGKIDIADITAMINIILTRAKYPDDVDNYDFDAANLNNDGMINIADLTALVAIIMGDEE